MQTQFHQYLQRPGLSTFLAAREACLNDMNFDPCTRILDEIERLTDEEMWSPAVQAVSDALPNYLLSPRLHLLAARVSRAMNEHETAEHESDVALALVEGILSTGDGSPEAPYLVMRTSDETDVMMRLGKDVRAKVLRRRNHRDYEVLVAEDGTQVWFDITEAYERLTTWPDVIANVS